MQAIMLAAGKGSRLGKYTKFQIIEVPDEADKSLEVSMKKESESIFKYITDKDYVIKEATLEKLLGVPNKDEYNLLLMHTPVYFNEYSNWGADLVLARSCSWRTCIYSVCRWSFLTR